MQISETALPDVKRVALRVHHDGRGHFVETWQAQRYQDALNVTTSFVQHNQSCSGYGVLRGLHFQRQRGQGKLIRVVQGCIWDVAVDVRIGSPTFAQWVGITLFDVASDAVHEQVWVPPGFAHGFMVLSSQAIVEYLCTDVYDPEDEVCLRWDDPDVNVGWPLEQPTLSCRDRKGAGLRELRDAGLLPVMVGSPA